MMTLDAQFRALPDDRKREVAWAFGLLRSERNARLAKYRRQLRRNDVRRFDTRALVRACEAQMRALPREEPTT